MAMSLGSCWVRAAALLMAASLAACTTADVKSPINGLTAATGQAKDKLVADQADIDKFVLETSANAATQPGALPVSWGEGECGGGEPRCHLFISDGMATWPLTTRSIEHGVLAIMDGLVQYGANLNKIAIATTAGEVQTALGQTKASVAGFATAEDDFRKASGLQPSGLKPLLTAYAGPTIDLISFGLTQYIERKKVAAIKEAVHTMQPVLDETVEAFEAVALEAARIRQTDIAKRFNAADAAFRRAHTDKTKLAALGSAADTYDQFLGLKDTKVFAGLANAHAALRDALDRKNLSFDEVWLQLKYVSDETAKFAALLQHLKDAGQ